MRGVVSRRSSHHSETALQYTVVYQPGQHQKPTHKSRMDPLRRTPEVTSLINIFHELG